MTVFIPEWGRPKDSICAYVEGGIVCGEKESAHTHEAAKLDVGMDHDFVPATWDEDDPMPADYGRECPRCLSIEHKHGCIRRATPNLP